MSQLMPQNNSNLYNKLLVPSYTLNKQDNTNIYI